MKTELNTPAHIFHTIQKICSEITGLEESEIRQNSSFFEDLGVGMDEFAEILSQVSVKLGIKISKEDTIGFHTIGDLLEFIEEQL